MSAQVSQKPRMKLLLVAYQCGPGLGSVSQIGWEWYARLCETHDVTLVTHVRNEAALKAAGAPLAGSTVLTIDTEWFAGPLYRLAKKIFPKSEHSVFLVSSLDYFVFDAVALRQLRQRMKDGAQWDLLHRVTPVTTAAPSLLGRLGIPTVVGPLNSGLNDPPGFAQVLRAESTWLVKVRGLTRLLDAVLGFSRRANCILVATRATRQQISHKLQSRCVSMLENGVDLERFSPSPWPVRPSVENPLRILFVGRLIPAKALSLLLEALPKLDAGIPFRLDVVGDGPLASTWQEQVAQLGLSDRVHFHGNQPASVVAAMMAKCHVFCLPSVRESGGAVVLEAMASARPVIAMNYGGPAELVDESTGHLIGMHSPKAAIDELARTLTNVAAYPEAWEARGQLGWKKVSEKFSWRAKIQDAATLYDQLVTTGGAR